MMKSFRTIVSEVAQPRGPEEKKFKDMHSYETKSHPVAPDAVFTGAIGADDLPKAKAKRKADQDGDVNYDKQFKEGKAYGPTGVSYYVPDGHEDEVDPATGKKKNSKKEGLDYNPAKGEYNQKPGKEVGKRVGTREAAVNELSKATLGSYAKKAVSDIDQQKKKADGYDKAANRSNNFKTITKNINKASSADHRADNRKKGIVKAVDKLTREELELEINEDLKMVSSEPHPKGGHIVTLVDKSGKKVIRHLKKGKVTDMGSRMKSSKYDEETQLDELSKKTLGAYAKAASNDQADHAQDTGKHYANNANYKGAMSSWKRDKRRDGVNMAVNKLMKKEEVETIKWPVYARFMEMRAAHNKGATEPEAMDSKASKGEKDFKAMHKVDMVPADLEKKGHDDASAAGRVTKPAAPRNGDNKAGDKSIVNPVAGAKA